MLELLVISDDPPHAKRLAKEIGRAETCGIHDLYDEAVPADRPGMIVSDVKDLTSDALVRLRRCLEALRSRDVPHLLLVHGNAARAEAHAQLIGAEAIPAATAAHVLSTRLKQPFRPPTYEAPLSLTAVRQADEAKHYLAHAFFSGETMTPALAETGTELVAQAINETGIRDWVRAVQRFDDVTHQHILLVAGLSTAFAVSLGLNAHDRHLLAKAALLHDVGKTKIPTAILNKPGRLDPNELTIMRTHPGIGHAMLAGSGFDASTLMVVRSHHEMLDGSGYPDGLQAAEIPDLVRLVTISDIYAALIEKRPYKAALSGSAALAIIDSMVGRLDGDLLRAFQPVAGAFELAAGGGAA